MAMRLLLTMTILALTLTGCNEACKTDGAACALSGSRPLLLNVTHGVDDAHEVTMALQLAGHALDQNRSVTLFFNVKGVSVPVESLDADLAFKDKPIKQLLASCVARGAKVLVCPHCMKAMQIEPADLIDDAQVADAESLFGVVDTGAAVFTY